jgi:RNA polymerase sigma factor (sigma-70 family)
MGVDIELLPLQVDNFDELSIQQLLELCLSEKSTEAAWCEFVRRTQPVIVGTIYKGLCGRLPVREELIEDLTQDTYAKLLKNDCAYLRSFVPRYENALYPYLKVATANTAEDYYRQWKRKHEEQLPEVFDYSAPGADPWTRMRIQEIFDYAEQKLSEQDYDIFVFYHRYGFTAREISELPGINRAENQVEYVLWDMMRELKDKFGGESHGFPCRNDD